MTVAPGLMKSSVTKAGRPMRRNQDVGAPAFLGQIGRARVADGHGRIFMQQQQRHRFTDNIAASDNHRVTTGDRDLVSL